MPSVHWSPPTATNATWNEPTAPQAEAATRDAHVPRAASRCNARCADRLREAADLLARAGRESVPRLGLSQGGRHDASSCPRNDRRTRRARGHATGSTPAARRSRHRHRAARDGAHRTLDAARTAARQRRSRCSCSPSVPGPRPSPRRAHPRGTARRHARGARTRRARRAARERAGRRAAPGRRDPRQPARDAVAQPATPAAARAARRDGAPVRDAARRGPRVPRAGGGRHAADDRADAASIPSGEAWLPVLHTERDGWHFTALFSNTAQAHQLEPHARLGA